MEYEETIKIIKLKQKDLRDSIDNLETIFWSLHHSDEITLVLYSNTVKELQNKKIEELRALEFAIEAIETLKGQSHKGKVELIREGK